MNPEDEGAGGPHAISSKSNGERRNSRRTSLDAAKVSQCTKTACVINDNEVDKFQCHDCKRHIHYRCSGLPVFQIQHFLYTKNYRKYVCESCTKVADHLKTVIPTPPSADPSKQISSLEATIENKQLEVDTLAETNRILQATIKEMTRGRSNAERCQKKEKDELENLQAEAKIMKTTISTYEEKIASLQSVIQENEKDIAESRQNQSQSANGNLAALTELMAKKFEEVETNLKKSILTEVGKSNKQLEEKFNEVVQANKSYKDALTNAEPNANTDGNSTPTTAPGDFRTIMRQERNEQLAEEADKKERASNIVVHGVVENSGEEQERKEHDKKIIDDLITDLGLELIYKSTFRLGKKIDGTEQSKRPLKIVMNNEGDKDRIMESLKNLKGKEKYRGISITEDHTTKERDTIREFVEKAKAANANEPVDSLYEWKVRGTPKNGIQLKKFRKRNLEAQA